MKTEIKEETRIEENINGFIELLCRNGRYVYINKNSIKSYSKITDSKFLIETDKNQYYLDEEQFNKFYLSMTDVRGF
tara:strand:- start:310 stop:540 length:231 start_codon:yes stop_codon:yes gene_type:complete